MERIQFQVNHLPKTRARVVVLGVQLERRVHLFVGDGGEEDAQVGGNILGGVNARPRLAVALVLLVGNNRRAGEVEALLVELRLVRVGDKVTINTGLQLEGVVGGNGATGILEGREVDGAQAGQVTTVAAHNGRDILVESLGVLVAGAGDETRGHDVGLGEELLGVASETGHFKQNLRTTGGETHGGDGVRVAAKGANVLVDPLECVLHIPEADVGDAALVEEGRAVGETGEAETVVVRNKDEVGGQIEETLGGVLGLGTAGETTAICPEENGERLVARVGRRPDVHVQTVLGAAAGDILIGQRAIVDLSLNGRPLRGSETQVSGGHGGEADVLVLVVAGGGVGCGRHKGGVVEGDGGCRVGLLANDPGWGQDGGRCCSGEQEGVGETHVRNKGNDRLSHTHTHTKRKYAYWGISRYRTNK